MRSCITFCLYLCVVLMHPSLGMALQPPPAQIVDEKVRPDCIVLQPSYLAGQNPGYGTGSKGPAVQLKNNCEGAMLVTSIQTSDSATAEKKPIVAQDVVLVTFNDDLATYKSYVFASHIDTCRKVAGRLEEEHWKLVDESEAERRQWELDKAKGVDDPLREWRYNNIPTRTPENKGAEVACGTISIPPDGVLKISIPWGTYFKISGISESAMKPKALSIEGKMINPRDPVEASALAAQGDNKARHTLALHYFDTKKHPYEDSVSLLKAAAESGYGPSRYQLGICYDTGYGGVPKNPEEAYFWYSVAGEMFKGVAEENLEALEKKLSETQLAVIKKRIEKWKRTHPASTWIESK